MLPAEEAGIDGPGTGSNHGQGGAEDRQDHVNPVIARLRENNPNLNDSDHCARQRSPEADEQKCPGYGPYHMRDTQQRLWRLSQEADRVGNESYGG